MKRSLLTWVGAGAAAAILGASVLVRFIGPADPAADVGDQRAAVARFHDLVRAGRWDAVYRATTEPPARDAATFAGMMRAQVNKHGTVTDVAIDELRLLRSRTTPMLEVNERVTLERNGRTRTVRTVSYFARRGERWLFAFSAPDES